MKTKKEIPFNVKLLKSGDKIVVRTKGFSPSSWAIRAVTHSYFNHVGDIIIENEHKFLVSLTPISNTVPVQQFKKDDNLFSLLSHKHITKLPIGMGDYVNGEKIRHQKTKKIYVVEAMPKGVLKTPIEKYLNTKKFDVKIVRFKETLCRDYNVFDYKRAIRTNVRRAKKSIGKKYDFAGVAGIGIRMPFKALLRLIPFVNKIPQINSNLLQHRDKVFCSENVCENAYNLPNAKIKRPFASRRHPKQICAITTPKDIGKSRCTDYICGTNKR